MINAAIFMSALIIVAPAPIAKDQNTELRKAIRSINQTPIKIETIQEQYRQSQRPRRQA